MIKEGNKGNKVFCILYPVRAVASGASLKFGVQGASATTWFLRVNGARDNGIRLYYNNIILEMSLCLSFNMTMTNTVEIYQNNVSDEP